MKMTKLHPNHLFFAAAVAAGIGINANPDLMAQKTAANTSKSNVATKPDGTARQTANPWTGSPIGPDGAFEYAGRARELRITEVMDELSIGPGKNVADIGAGGGWFSMLAARRVGPRGRVYAQEILPKYTRFIARRARREGLKNVRAILGTTTDPKLPANTMDAVLILNAYHEFEQPLAILRRVRAAMKPGARLGFIERDDDTLRESARDAIARSGQPKHRVDEKPDGKEWTDDHRLALPIVEREAALAGFVKVSAVELNNDHYLLVVQKPLR